VISARVKEITAPDPMAVTTIAFINIELDPRIGGIQKRTGHCELVAKCSSFVDDYTTCNC
jgi:hypothetical protein